MKTILQIATIGSFLFGPSFCLADTTPADSVPKEIEAALKTSYRDWEIQTFTNLGPTEKAKWTKTNQSDCPGIATGHFTSKSLLDYVLLLIPKDSKKLGYKVLLFSPKNGGFVITPVTKGRAHARSHDGVWNGNKPGGYATYNAAGEKVDSAFKLDLIAVETREDSTELFYWSKGHFHMLSAQH
jgi:hypothetical protein